MGAPELRVLRRALKGEKDPARKVAVQFMLAGVLAKEADHTGSSELYRAIADVLPQDRLVREEYIWQLRNGDLFDEANAEVERYEEQFGEPVAFANSVRHHSWAHQGQFELALANVQQGQAAGTATPQDMANVAWHALFAETDLAPAIALAESALALKEMAPAVHTLAALYLEHGDLDKAYQQLAKTRQLDTNGSRDQENWYLVGRLAERLGLPYSAKRAYGRLRRPEHLKSCDTYALFERVRSQH